MRTLNVSLPHDLTPTEVRRRVQLLLQELQRSGGHWTQRWTSASCLQFIVELTGGTVTGQLAVQEEQLDITIHLPWTLQFLAGRIRAALEQSARQALLPA